MSLRQQQIIPLPGYPQQWGTKNVELGEMVGPSSYATGGVTINASSFGWGGFDRFAATGRSYSGTYSAQVQPLPITAGAKSNQSIKSYKVVWIVIATGAEVANAVDLSAEIMRFEAVGC